MANPGGIPARRLKPLVEKLPGSILRESMRGVPHIVYGEYSIAFFGKANSYRIFYPWPSFRGQQKWDFKSHGEVVNFLKGRLNGKEISEGL
jgi:hypothetical protein